MSEETRLPALRRAGDGEPVVLLHGFGGGKEQWEPLMAALAAHALAYDLPGHGEAATWDGFERPAVTRDAVLRDWDARGIERSHLVGHSRGGAMAALIAMKAPDRIASLTFVAPGGFGPEIADEELALFAAARSEGELRDAMLQLFRPQRPSRRAVGELASRRDERTVENLLRLRETMTSDGRQATLDLARLHDRAFPIVVIWGDEDAVLPASQAHAIGEREVVHVVPGAGHMLPQTHPRTLADILLTTMGATSASS